MRPYKAHAYLVSFYKYIQTHSIYNVAVATGSRQIYPSWVCGVHPYCYVPLVNSWLCFLLMTPRSHLVPNLCMTLVCHQAKMYLEV